MQVFAQQPKKTPQTTSAKSAIPGVAHVVQDSKSNSILHLQRTTGKAVLLPINANTAAVEGHSTTANTAPFGHDFSRIRVYPGAPAKTRTKRAANSSGDAYEPEADPIADHVMAKPPSSDRRQGGSFGNLPIQPKLRVGAVDDPLEREADRFADSVVRMPDPRVASVSAGSFTSGLQRKCACGGSCPKCQDEQGDPQQEHLQRKSLRSDAAVEIPVPPTIQEVLRSSGQPLDQATRAFLEPRFGLDFSRVRIHTDATAADSAREVNALAYTVGRDVVFGTAQYQPGTPKGRRLLAHELAHVAQQNQGGLRSMPCETGERIAGSPASPAPAGLMIQRSAKFVAGTEQEDHNLAEMVLTGKTVATAEALPVLNGAAFLNTGKTDSRTVAKQIDDLIAKPTPEVKELPNKGGFECSLKSVGSNEGSYEMHLPVKPPWTQDTTMDKLRSAFEHYDPPIRVPSECRTGDGGTNLTVEGDPDAATVAKDIKAHEQHHADDYKAAFNDTIVPWDQKLTHLLQSDKKAAKKFQGKDPQPCVDEIIKSVGGSRQVAEKFLKEIVDKASAFHGSNPQLQFDRDSSRALPSCSKVTLKAKLPKGKP